MYCCDGEERQQLMNICKENERKKLEELNQNYDASGLFKNIEENTGNIENIANNKIAVIGEEKWYQKLYTKIKSFVNRIFGK